MTLYTETGVQVDSWVDMARDVPMRYEINKLDVRATLYFGQRDNYVLSLYRDDLAQVIDLASRALSDLNHAEDGKSIPSGVRPDANNERACVD